MDTKDLERMLNSAYSGLSLARTNLFEAGNSLIKWNMELNTEKNRLISSGGITGKNVAEREADLSTKLTYQYEKVNEAEVAERKMRYHFDMAGYKVEEARALLRLAQLANGGNNGNQGSH